jgi:hypothetical protein
MNDEKEQFQEILKNLVIPEFSANFDLKLIDTSVHQINESNSKGELKGMAPFFANYFGFKSVNLSFVIKFSVILILCTYLYKYQIHDDLMVTDLISDLTLSTI